MKINIGIIIMKLYAKSERITFQEARKYIKYIHIEHARNKIDSKMAHSMTIKVLSSLVLCYPIKMDIKSFDIERTISFLLVEDKKLTFQEAKELIIHIELAHARSKIDSQIAYKYTIKALNSLATNYLDEVVICA